MTRYTTLLIASVILCANPFSHAFQTSQMLPMRVDPISRQEICQRLGLKETDPKNEHSSMLSIGSGPNMAYTLTNEHELVCPISGIHQGVLCTANLPPQSALIAESENTDSIANNHDLVSQAIFSGSLAASIRNRCKDGNSMYYLPSVITLVESLMADEIQHMDWGQMAFNSDGLETNEILMDMTNDFDHGLSRQGGESVTLYACNTQSDQYSTTSDVYVLPQEKNGKIWRFSVEFKVAMINLQQISSFGKRDSTTPLRPDVWLKDDSY